MTTQTTRADADPSVTKTHRQLSRATKDLIFGSVAGMVSKVFEHPLYVDPTCMAHRALATWSKCDYRHSHMIYHIIRVPLTVSERLSSTKDFVVSFVYVFSFCLIQSVSWTGGNAN